MTEIKGKLNEPLSSHCTFMVGGPADVFYECSEESELPALIDYAKEKGVPYFILGAGSNVLFDDEGFRGLVIKLKMNDVKIDGTQITAGAGVIVAALIQKSIESGLSGMEKWVGLPGTVGGAVYGNAGCNGLETKDILISAKLFNPEEENPDKQIYEKTASYFEFDYRTSKLKSSKEIILSATFQLSESELSPEDQKSIMTEIRTFRTQMQPFGASSGSFFKNPSPGQPAGKLIDEAGLKGKIIGKAQISEKHGNFFLNLGGATASDIKELAALAKREVKAKFGVDLHEEVQVLSEYGKSILGA